MLKSRGPGLQNVTFFGDRVIADVISNEVTLEEGGPNRAGLVSLQETACDDRAPEAGKDPPQVAGGAQPCQNLVPDFHDSQTLSVLAGGTGCGSLRLWLSALGPCRQRHQVWLDVPKLRQASLETAGVQQVLQFPPRPPEPQSRLPCWQPCPRHQRHPAGGLARQEAGSDPGLATHRICKPGLWGSQCTWGQRGGKATREALRGPGVCSRLGFQRRAPGGRHGSTTTAHLLLCRVMFEALTLGANPERGLGLCLQERKLRAPSHTGTSTSW